jgi:hypothetical protein
MELDAHKSAVARAYGLASEGYNKPALRFFSQGAESLVDFAGLSPGLKILDAASGTCHAALYASRWWTLPMHMRADSRHRTCVLN